MIHLGFTGYDFRFIKNVLKTREKLSVDEINT